VAPAINAQPGNGPSFAASAPPLTSRFPETANALPAVRANTTANTALVR